MKHFSVKSFTVLALSFGVFCLVSCNGAGSSPSDTVGKNPVEISNFGQPVTSSDSSVKYQWETDVAADCTLHYGPFPFYGLEELASPENGDQKLRHSATISGLEILTDYDVYVEAVPESADYSTGVSGNTSYTTTSQVPGTVCDVADTFTEAVGAVCFNDADGYYGPICTGVLIESGWVITSAHCLDGSLNNYGRTPSAANTAFYIGGDDAYPGSGNTEPAEGTLYSIKSITFHAGYTMGSTPSSNDLALIELDQDVSGISPLPINDSDQILNVGDDFQCISFEPGYSKQKRKVASGQEISSFDSQVFYTADNYHLGDNGSAAIMDMSSTATPDYRLIGVIITADSSGSDPPFQGNSAYSDIFDYEAWISGITGS